MAFRLSADSVAATSSRVYEYHNRRDCTSSVDELDRISGRTFVADPFPL
jgi:hypothetical protein